MFYALFLALLLALQVSPPPAAAQPSMDAQCEAWLCLPGGFGPAECNPAKAAVDWRLSRVPPLDPLPPWSSCAAHYSAIQANLRFDNNYRPPGCGRSTGHGTVWVRVDGNRVGSAYAYTRQEPIRPCPPPPPRRLPVVQRPDTDPTDTDPTDTDPTDTDPTDTGRLTDLEETCLSPPCDEAPPPETDPCVINPASCIKPTTCEERGDCPPPPTCEELGNCPKETTTCEERGDCPPPPTCEELGNCPKPDPDPPYVPPVGPPVPPPPAAVGGAPAVN